MMKKKYKVDVAVIETKAKLLRHYMNERRLCRKIKHKETNMFMIFNNISLLFYSKSSNTY